MQMKLSQRIVFSAGVFAIFSMVTTEAHASSLWVKAGNVEQSMFADSRARNIGDILTIVVQEDTSSMQTARIKTYDSVQGGAGIFPALNATLNGFVQALPSWLSKGTGGSVQEGDVTIPTLDLAAKSEWTGGGDVANSVTVTNRTSVTVVDVLPNGNMVIEGAKIIKAGKETQYAYLRGVVRPVDVKADNTILSTQVADAQVEFVPEGDLSDAQKKGWLLRAWDKVKPF